jgi:hypothetical protein
MDEFHTENPQVLGANIVSLVARLEVHGQPVASFAVLSRL